MTRDTFIIGLYLPSIITYITYMKKKFRCCVYDVGLYIRHHTQGGHCYLIVIIKKR